MDERWHRELEEVAAAGDVADVAELHRSVAGPSVRGASHAAYVAVRDMANGVDSMDVRRDLGAALSAPEWITVARVRFRPAP